MSGGYTVVTSSYTFEGESIPVLENRPRTQETAALLVCLHPAYTSPRTFSSLIETESLCRRKGVHILIPGCLDGERWNENPNPGWIRERDDVGFLQGLIAQRVTDFTSDKVYVVGYSSGGQMAIRLLYEGSDFDAVATVASARLKAYDLQDGWEVDHVPSIMMINGTADTQIGYNPGKQGMYSVPESIKYWAGLTGVSRPRTKKNFLNTSPGDGCTAYRETYKGTKPVQLITVTNGGHTWPGSTKNPAIYGATCQDFNATDQIWSFLIDS